MNANMTKNINLIISELTELFPKRPRLSMANLNRISVTYSKMFTNFHLWFGNKCFLKTTH